MSDTSFWSRYYNKLTDNSSNVEHVVNCFFYIKGSKDYPNGQNLDERFGYDLDSQSNISETPVFTNSIKDIYTSKSNLLEVFNNYSSESGDPNNKIDAEITDRTHFFENDLFGNQRNNGNPDYISTLLIDTNFSDSFERELFKHIDPNFTLAPSNGDETVSEYISEINNKLLATTGNNGTTLEESMKLRFNIFWKEIFSCLERIKMDEDEIYRKFGQSNLPIDLNDHFLSSSQYPWFDNTNGDIEEKTKISFLRKCPNITSWLWALYPCDIQVDIGEGGSQVLKYKSGLDNGYCVNPFRLAKTQGDPNTADFLTPSKQYINNGDFLGVHLSQIANNDQNYKNYIAQIKDQLIGTQWWDKTGTTNASLTDMMITDGIEMQLVDPSQPSHNFTVVSDVSNRIKAFTFKIKFVIAHTKDRQNKDVFVYDTWRFNVYFDPEDFIRSNNENASIFPVWTFNEKDIDEAIRRSHGAIETPGITIGENGTISINPNFNYLDNDYANALIPDREENKNIRNHFIASKSEIQTQFISELIKKVKDGGYEHYVTLTVDRVTPILNPDKNTIVWNPSEYDYGNYGEINNVTSQEFYVFYKGTITPSVAQQKEAIRNYLIKLHENCKPTSYNADDNSIIETIGHDNSQQDIINFLANMYPDLFSKSEIYIIPTNGGYYDSSNGEQPDYVASNYFNTITPERIVQSIRAITGVDSLKKYILDKFGANNQTIEQENGLALPTEIFYIGSVNATSVEGNAPIMQYPMPWYAVSSSLNATNVLTNIDGFKDYCPKAFTANNLSAVSTADLFQLIMIYLTKQMFTANSEIDGVVRYKPMYKSIFGIPIEYDTDIITDNSVVGEDNTTKFYNKASFVLKGITFIVYSQIGKNFGSSKSMLIEESNNPFAV